jgi:hypothetical protein
VITRLKICLPETTPHLILCINVFKILHTEEGIYSIWLGKQYKYIKIKMYYFESENLRTRKKVKREI